MNATNNNEAVTEIEVFYRGMAMLGMLQCGGWSHEEIPDLAKDMARRMMEDSTAEVGLAAVKPKRKYNRK